ncbi:AMP-binding protein [Mycolicibacterium komossense]|uniref:AMP-binding protein n=2 Tax=Mycolicibacterium komossense TaxID=1779 RepID=A0ABT3CJ94_9MYCO|nr:AMP-binding protein [Mycolicibacterium komossense]
MDFAAAARNWPDRPAVMHGDIVITYRQLANRVRLTASRYRARGFGGSPRLIGALVTHTPAVVEHLLGILQAGAAYCPIDAAFPDARKQDLTAVLALDRLYAVAPGLCAPTNVRIETLDGDNPLADDGIWESTCQPTDAAYVLCTSGSTGNPKPVAVSRLALTVTVRALRELFALTPEDRVLQFASLGWDTCLEEMLPALTAGATMVFDDVAHCGSLPLFVRMLAERKITVLDLPTAFWHELVLFLDEEQMALPDCVRLVVIGGERIDPTRLGQWRDLVTGHARLLNTYGCTETTMVTHAVQLTGPDTEPEFESRTSEISLGRPLPHVRDHVTAEGELWISGPALATGYLGLPELTARGFPFVDDGSGPVRWFRTGDIVSRGQNQLLYSRGRTDEQVKVAGVRVHPAEVEAQLNSHPAVSGAVVVGERRLGRTVLVAYVALSGIVSTADLKEYVRSRLPIQFVPARVQFVSRLAYTASGKLDRTGTRRAAAEHDNKGADR